MSETFELLRSAPIASLMLGRTGQVVDHNDEAARLLGRAAPELTGSLFTLFLVAASVPDFLKHLWDSFNHPEITHLCPLQLLRGDGSRREIIIKSRVGEFPTGYKKHCSSIILEQQSTSLRDTDAALELFEQIPYGLAWLDADERIVECNGAFARLFDFLSSQLVECPVRTLFFDWTSEAVLASALSGQSLRLHGVCRDGRLVPVEAQLFSTQRSTLPRAYLFLVRDLRVQEALERRSLRIAELERRSVGRELHDVLGQNLIGMALLGDELASRLSDHPLDDSATQDLETRARRLARLCRETNAIATNLVRGLVPVGLDQGKLSAALRDLASSCSQTHGVECRARGDEVEGLETASAEHLFRIAQEAVTNALKHSQCSKIELRLSRKGQDVTLIVTDNGRGINKADSQRFGTGFHAMRHRCGLIGARLSIRQLVEGGTSIIVSLRTPMEVTHPPEFPA